MKKAVGVIAVLSTLASVIYVIIGGIQLSTEDITWTSFLTTIITLVLNLILLWALHNALSRIENLENNVSRLNDNAPKSEVVKMVDASNKSRNPLATHSSTATPTPINVSNNAYKQCQACGAIERTSDDRCPLCGAPYETNNKSKKKK